MTALVLIAVCCACAAASYALSRFAVLPWLRRRGVLDHPTVRSSHDAPVVRGGGVAVVLTVLLGGAAVSSAAVWALYGDPPWALSVLGAAAEAPPTAVLTAVLPPLAAAGFGLIGLIDDFNSLSAAGRLIVQVLLSTALAVCLTVTGGMLGIPFGLAGALSVALSLVLAVNAVNFMDGLNTLITAWGAIAALWLGGAGLLAGQPLAAAGAIVLAGALAGFLPLNRTPADAFLGDVGSYAVGGGLAVLGWLVWTGGAPAVVALAPFVVPVFDVLLTLCVRLARGENIFAAHRSHIYQRTRAAGELEHEQVSVLHLGAVVLCLAAVGLVPLLPASLGFPAVLLTWAAVLACYALAPRAAEALRTRTGGRA
ncbi:glycosyltransferase family 4 protein [Brevibacterium album]|uniref:glycosyltransferase family 4 protein n=1 Tax=Brevibacterium album TaxID=417948 RepID=UPI0003FB47DD|nr:hypothetical protein [Brevibacterium album]